MQSDLKQPCFIRKWKLDELKKKKKAQPLSLTFPRLQAGGTFYRRSCSVPVSPLTAHAWSYQGLLSPLFLTSGTMPHNLLIPFFYVSSFYVCLFLLMTQWFSLVLLIKYGHLTNSYNTEENVSPFGINHQLLYAFVSCIPLHDTILMAPVLFR